VSVRVISDDLGILTNRTPKNMSDSCKHVRQKHVVSVRTVELTGAVRPRTRFVRRKTGWQTLDEDR
jgi:hypothetical protein